MRRPPSRRQRRPAPRRLSAEPPAAPPPVPSAPAPVTAERSGRSAGSESGATGPAAAGEERPPAGVGDRGGGTQDRRHERRAAAPGVRHCREARQQAASARAAAAGRGDFATGSGLYKSAQGRESEGVRLQRAGQERTGRPRISRSRQTLHQGRSRSPATSRTLRLRRSPRRGQRSPTRLHLRRPNQSARRAAGVSAGDDCSTACDRACPAGHSHTCHRSPRRRHRPRSIPP